MLDKNVLFQSSRITNFILSSKLFGSRDRIDIFNEWSQPEKLRLIDRSQQEHIRCRLSGGLKMEALTLQALASMSYTDFQKIIDAEGKISGLQRFKNSGLSSELQNEIRNVLSTQEAL